MRKRELRGVKPQSAKGGAAYRGSEKLMKEFLSCLLVSCAEPSSDVVMPKVRA